MSTHDRDQAVERLWRPGLPLDRGGYPGFRPGTDTVDGIRIDRDVAVTMRDGTTIYTDIFRPEGVGAVPAIIAWSPYGKHDVGPGTFDRFPNRTCVPEGVPGQWTKFEAPDPEYWCPHGYAVINPDARGSWMSDGDLCTVGGQEAQDIYDLVEWLATCPWSNGKVALSGNSWLGQCQWFVAALRPPHLAAIAPWEGWSDLYRENVAVGGITTEPSNWMEFVWGELYSRTRVEDCPAMALRYPVWNSYWEEKQAKHELTEVPAYVVASWNSRLHSRGTFEAFKRLGSEQKWLRIHDGWEWPDYYDEANVEDLRTFFDHFLRGVENDWLQTPRVRVAIMDQPISTPSSTYRVEAEWPPSRTEHAACYLDAATGRIHPAPVVTEASTSYPALTGSASFDWVFDEDTELTGHMSLHLHVSVTGANDMDLFVVAQKLDAAGERVDFRTYGVGWPAEPARGFLRVSHRELDLARSRVGQPWHSHRIEEFLTEGEIVPVDIEFWPMGCRWRAGEAIRIVIAGHPLMHAGDPTTGAPLRSTRNGGDHIIWTGGQYDSHLLMPVTREA